MTSSSPLEHGGVAETDVTPFVSWQRAVRRRERADVPAGETGFWASFFAGTRALATFDEPRALELLLQAEVDCPDDLAVRAALNESLGEARFLLNDYALAAAHFRSAQQVWRELPQPLWDAEVRGWLGACLVQQGEYRDGFEQLQSAIDDLTQLGNPGRAARALNYLAIVYEELGDLAKARLTYTRALIAAGEDGDRDMEGRVLANHGEAHVIAGDVAAGLLLLERAVEVLRSIQAHWHYGWCQLAIGRVLLQQGGEARARAQYEAALEAVERGHSPRARVEVYAGMGELHSRCGRHDEARVWLDRALELARRLNIRREVFKTHRLYAEARKRARDFEGALHHHEQFHEVRAEVFDQVARQRIETLRAELELERVKQARELERVRNEELTARYAELEAQANTLTHLSQRDGLTGLFNRRHFDEVLPVELARARSFGQRLSVVLLDIDHFKRINDGFSHLTGDAVLKQVAAVLQRELRTSDLAARYGGEELVLVLPHTSLDGARIAAEKVRAAIAGAAWSQLGPGLKVTASLGVAEARADDTVLTLVRRADQALYAAKQAGRDRVRAA
ncbi:MAG: diguanylate cyclase [Myxococcaceae bacterium]|nr:diguanylate cyclase [Myxococcaceae bacterium]